jgi:hypothetical protein
MKLTLGEQSIDFSKTEWERAKSLISETKWEGDEGEVGVLTDEESADNAPIKTSDALEFMRVDCDRVLGLLKSSPEAKVTEPATVMGLPILISGTRGQFKQQYRDAVNYLSLTVTGPNVKSVTIERLGDNAQHSVVVE